MSIEDLYKNFYRSFIQAHVKVIIKHMSNKQRIITKKQDLIIKKKSKIIAGNNCLRKTAETENKTALRFLLARAKSKYNELHCYYCLLKEMMLRKQIIYTIS